MHMEELVAAFAENMAQTQDNNTPLHIICTVLLQKSAHRQCTVHVHQRERWASFPVFLPSSMKDCPCCWV